MDDWIVSSLLTLVITLLGSSGFWAYLQKKDGTRKATQQLLLGLTYDRITFLGMKYIERGFITKDEYEDLQKFFYKPYTELGGNGMAERIMKEIGTLPIRSNRQAFSASIDDLRQNKK